MNPALTLRNFALRHLVADAAPLSAAERWRSALAALFGFLITEGVLAVLPATTETRHLLLPLGATAVILYTLPHSPLGQPWSVAGGLVVSALAGLACGRWVPWPALAGALSIALAIWLMARLRCLHPPGGALALTLALAPPAVGVEMAVVGANVLATLIAVVAVNNLIPGRRYPQCVTSHAPAADSTPPLARPGVAHEDLQYALGRLDTFLDISEDDLVAVYNLAAESAFRRHVTLRCKDIMTPAPVTAEFSTELNDAWSRLRRHHIKALPVVDRARRVIGLVGVEDFLAHVAADARRPVGDNIRALLRPTPGMYAHKPEVVGQIMEEGVLTAREDDDLGAVAAALAVRGHPRAIPVVDGDGRLTGILSQTDLVAALFHQLALERAAGPDAGDARSDPPNS